MADAPRSWCDPPESFGRLDAEKRVWLPPSGADPVLATKFGAAVVQSAICLHTRMFKNEIGMAQEQLARHDSRPDSFKAWNARLCGRRAMTLQDIAVLLSIVPGAFPGEAQIRDFLQVTTGEAGPPLGWRWPDTSAALQRPQHA